MNEPDEAASNEESISNRENVDGMYIEMRKFLRQSLQST